ncbi:MAG: zinc ABC transporter substrate-binding protein [Planctomycetota bacterium]|nr:MAG: zinc ABC transporter substrate-binding protein [Planctomycetota bacterium]
MLNSRCLRLVGLTLIPALLYISPASGETPSKDIKTFVSIMPQAYFVERVGGPSVEVEVLVAPGQSPATFEPTPRQMAALAGADVYFRIGLPFEDQLLAAIAAINEGLPVIDTREGIELRPMDESGHEGDDHEHDQHGRFDPHVWLDPELVQVQARNIMAGLAKLNPAGKVEYEKNLRQFQAELADLDSTIAQILAPLKGREIYVFHPSYGYFAGAYGLKQVAVETGGKEPGARQLADLIERAIRDSVRVVFVQPQFSQKSAKTIAEAIGGAVVPLDPLARDYLANLGRMARAIERGLMGDGK